LVDDGFKQPHFVFFAVKVNNMSQDAAEAIVALMQLKASPSGAPVGLAKLQVKNLIVSAFSVLQPPPSLPLLLAEEQQQQQSSPPIRIHLPGSGSPTSIRIKLKQPPPPPPSAPPPQQSTTGFAQFLFFQQMMKMQQT
jgi:hypothetical protein